MLPNEFLFLNFTAKSLRPPRSKLSKKSSSSRPKPRPDHTEWFFFFARELELLSLNGSNLTGHFCWKRRNQISHTGIFAHTPQLFHQEPQRYDILYRCGWVLNSSDETLGAVKGNYHRWNLWATHVNCLQRRTFGRQTAGIVLFTPSQDDSVRIHYCIVMVQWRLSCWTVIQEREHSPLQVYFSTFLELLYFTKQPETLPQNRPSKTKKEKKSPLAACQRSRLTHRSFKRKNRFPQAGGGSLNLATSQMDVFETTRWLTNH